MDDDDLLSEMLVRLPPLPSTLLRASLVCKRWRGLLSDPQFLRRLRAHHRQPPLLGIFAYDISSIRFTPMLEPPDRIPSARLSLPLLNSNERWHFLGCRHGLALLLNRTRFELTVWDPVTGDQRRFALPLGFNTKDGRGVVSTAALLCDESRQAFKVVLLCRDHEPSDGDLQVFASVYDSETGVWGSIISAFIPAILWPGKPSILAGNSLCCWLHGYGTVVIVEFDLDRQSFAVIAMPVDAKVNQYSRFQILRMEDNSLGLAILTDQSIQLWVWKEGSDAVLRWMLQKTVQLGKLLSLPAESTWPVIVGYDEDGHVIFIWTDTGVFMIQLESLQFRNLFETNIINDYYPYTCFYTTGRGIGSRDA